MADFPIFDLSFELAASKRKSYREELVSSYSALVHFLQDNGLTSRELLASDKAPDHSFKLMKSDLTAEGYEVLKRGLREWMVRTENPANDLTVLERELTRIRSYRG
jgi:hypothetical protein